MATAHNVKKQKKRPVRSRKNAPHAHAWVLEKYRTYMPVKRHYRVVIWVACLIVAIIIGLQLAYPHGRGLPLASVAGQSLRLASHDEMAKVITEKFNQTRVKVTVDTVKSIEFDLKSAGAEPNTEVMIERFTTYPLWQRFIPGSNDT